MISPEDVGLSSERLARIRPAVGKHIGDDKIAGAVTLVARREKVAHLECVGLMDRESNKPMQPDAIFRIYSMTKPITCVALMMLYEQGRFSYSTRSPSSSPPSTISRSMKAERDRISNSWISSVRSRFEIC